MDFSWTPEQAEFRRTVIEFARKSLQDDVVSRDRTSAFSRELWSRCGAFGIQGMPFPEEYGGSGSDILTTILAMEALGYACKDNGLLFALAAQMWSVQMPIFKFGGEELKQKYLPKLCSGAQIGAHGMSEPDSGSDAFSLRTIAAKRGDHDLLNGSKTFVSEGPVADVFVIFATIDRSLGFLGLTGFVVERQWQGVQVSAAIEKMGLRTSPMAEVVFQDCRVPIENRLGREGRGGEIFNDSMEWERGCILASYIGSMERQVEACVRYARERHQFGQSIGHFQAVAHKLADMKVRLEAARLLLYKAAWHKERCKPGDGTLEASMAKLYLSEAWIQSCLDAVQIHGGYGFTTEYEVERDLRDAIGGTLYSGTSEMQRNLIARKLGV